MVAVEHRGAAQQAFPADRLERFHIDVFRFQLGGQFVVVMGAHHGGDDAAGAGAGDHRGQQALFPEGFRHADVEQPQGGAAGEHQAALPESLAGGFEEIQFLLEPELGEVAVTEVVQGGAYLFQIALDQPLGAGAAVAVESGVGDIAQVAVQAFMQVKDQFVDVVALAGLADLPQAVTDQFVIVVGRAVDVFPLVGAAEPVVFTAGTAPFVVAAGLRDSALKLLERAFHAVLPGGYCFYRCPRV